MPGNAPAINTLTVVTSTYNSPRSYRQSYKVQPPTLQYSRESRSPYYRPSGDSSVRDNWILGKGANALDGWDGWSVVQGEKRYWDSKLGKPEYRGKCGGAAANRLSEEKIIKKLTTTNVLQDCEVPAGSRRTDVLVEKRRDRIASLSDQLLQEYFPDVAKGSRSSSARGSPTNNHLQSSTTSSPRKGFGGVGGNSPRSTIGRSHDADHKIPAAPPPVNHTSKVMRRRREDVITEPPQRAPFVSAPIPMPLFHTLAQSIVQNNTNNTTNSPRGLKTPRGGAEAAALPPISPSSAKGTSRR